MLQPRVAKLFPVVLICGVSLTLGASSLATAGETGSESFDGACQMSGVVRHDPPLTGVPAPTEVRGSFTGTCSGRFTDEDGRTRRLEEVPSAYRVRDAGGALSCLGGTATGTGRLLLGQGREIDFRLTERRPVPGVAIVSLEGADGGSATVFGTLSPSEDLMALYEQCNGSGLRLIRGDARIVSVGLSG